jgi:SWI/SNF-related matrix-associated actin-dependent regulator 1 of chromatin subfamily A
MSFELMAFQAKGANLLATSHRAMLVWDAGVGKTPTTVRAAMKTGAVRILVFCPPIAVSVWRQHFVDWSNIRDIRIFDATAAAKPYDFMAGEGVRIVPFSRLAQSRSVIEAASRAPFDVAIVDEAHYLKNPEAIRTQAIYGERLDLKGSPLATTPHVWCLSGTPILNHAAEFWTHLHALRPDLIVLPQLGAMDYDTFVDRFCVVARGGPRGLRIVGSRNTYELGQRLKPFIDRKKLRDVLPELPELRIVEHSLPADTAIERSLRVELAQAMAGATLDRNIDALDDDQLLGMVQSSMVAFSTVRRLIGRAKVEGVAELVSDFLEDNLDEKLIVFAHHREVIRDLAERLKAYAPLVITGETNARNREMVIGAFQANPKRRLIVLAIEAAGESITLHAAHNVVIAEMSPVPAKNHQAIARAHRNGQRNAVLARFVLLPGTLDARLVSIVARKTREIAQIVDNTPVQRATRVDFPDAI